MKPPWVDMTTLPRVTWSQRNSLQRAWVLWVLEKAWAAGPQSSRTVGFTMLALRAGMCLGLQGLLRTPQPYVWTFSQQPSAYRGACGRSRRSSPESNRSIQNSASGKKEASPAFERPATPQADSPTVGLPHSAYRAEAPGWGCWSPRQRPALQEGGRLGTRSASFNRKTKDHQELRVGSQIATGSLSLH